MDQIAEQVNELTYKTGVAGATDKVAHALTGLLAHNRPRYSLLGFKLLEKDPVVETFRSLGFQVVEYDLPPYPLRLAGFIAIRMILFITITSIIAYGLYHHVAKRSKLLNWGCIGGLIFTFMIWPLATGMSGVMLLDFWRPALGFRSSMLVWDIFRIRTREEVNSWNFFRFLAHLWAFPKEEQEIAERTAREGFARDPRIQNLKGLPPVFLEFVALLLTLYFIPPQEYTEGMNRLSYHLYCDMLGLSILMALALFGDGILKSLGIIIGVEQESMFRNPLGTTNIRKFWTNWNRAIASVLHRVVFGGGKKQANAPVARKPSKHLTQAQRLAAASKRPTYDHLSETEAEHDHANDSDGSASIGRSSALKPMSTLAKKGGSTDTQAVNGNSSAPKRSSSGKGKSSFLPKALAAMATFAMSGIFHEHITYFTLGTADGSNFLFFILNGVATVTSTWFRRTYPAANERIPTLVAVIMLHAFFLAVSPLFCSPFIKSGFFIQLDALKYELLPIMDRKRGAFIYLFGK